MVNTAVELDTELLTREDFEPCCQVVYENIYTGEVMRTCEKPAQWLGEVHQHHSCAWIQKFICNECLEDLKKTACMHRDVIYRLRNVVPVRMQ